MLLAGQQGASAPRASVEQIGEFISTVMDSEPRGRLMTEAEPTALEALKQLAHLTESEEGDGAVESAIWEWVMLGAQAEDGTPLVDRMVARLPRALTEPERGALRAFHESRFGLYEILAFPGEGSAQVRDRLSDETSELGAPGLAERFKVGESVACFVTPAAEGPSVLLGSWGLPQGAEDAIGVRLRELRAESPLKDIPLPEFLTRLSLVIPLLIVENMSERDSGRVGEGELPPPDFF